MAKRAKTKAEARARVQEAAVKAERPVSKYWVWGLLALVMVVVAVLRIRLLGVPLERDEGEYAYAGRLLLQGVPPYSMVYNMKFPGIYAAYALVMAVFGQSPVGIHLGLLALNLGSMALVFVLARRLFDPYAGVVAATAYGAFALARWVLGFAAHATNFMVPPMLGGLLLMLKALESRKWPLMFLSGLLLGLVPMIKQQGSPIVLFGGLYLIWALAARKDRWPDCLKMAASFAVGAVIPFAAVLLWMKQAGVFTNFWFWCFQYAGQYAQRVSLSDGMALLRDQVGYMLGSGLLLLCLAGVGLAATIAERKSGERKTFVLGFLVFSFLCVCPGLYFREHYFVIMLPALAILVGAGVRYLRRLNLPAWLRIAPALLVVVSVGYLVSKESSLMLAPADAYVGRAYPGCPFAEAVEVGRYIRTRARSGDKIAVLGSEPEISFYSRLRPATSYIYVYSLMEDQKYAPRMQREMIRQIERSNPRYIVFVDVINSWANGPSSNTALFEWAIKYCSTHGKLVGLAEMVAPGEADYYWDAEARSHVRTTESAIAVFERKGS